ncbi:hypothetical protein LTR37_011031 [Vermiconidia calcicola]|uniref:Uncharacterized protein n=1 Tax=Vermiconidia calcicola TaxID=1690605 RepID=A0ACC3N3Z7_9PEZI|nr:hypothetical protein LTR37_011031 [Vermiconidia calcicola]
MSVDLLGNDLDELLDRTSGMTISSEPINVVRTLQHFQSATSLTLGGERCRGVMHTFVARKAWEYPYLMHILLAVSAAHLKRLHAISSQPKLHRQYSIAEAAHWQTGLRLYRQVLDEANKAAGPKPDFDATLTTTFLTVYFIFSLDDDIPPDTFSSQDDEKLLHAVNPLSATAGFRVIREVYGDYMNSSVWIPVMQGSDDGSGTFSNADTPGIDGLPAAFVELCELDETSNGQNNQYHFVLRLLVPLLRLERDSENFTKLIAYSGR